MNVLSDRYASSFMKNIWSRENLILKGREFWITVLKAQYRNNTDPLIFQAIEDYEDVKNDINISSIDVREYVLKHDVMAEIHEFNELAGHELIHQGLTSRDKTDNVEQSLISDSMNLIEDRILAVLHRLKLKCIEYQDVSICGRSHLVPGQITTLGKRFANIAQELLINYRSFSHSNNNFRLRGIKGPMGTQQDLVSYMGSVEDALSLDNDIGMSLGGNPPLTAVGQVYPRSMDFNIISNLVLIASPLANLAKMVRLMAGLGLMHEGFGKDQVGSSAMPHKINSRTCERICGLHNVLKGHLAMIANVAGDQWLEGDVSCSVVRRVVFPDAFYALDGMIEATLTVLDNMVAHEDKIQEEIERYLPALSTTALLKAAIDHGLSREKAHEFIRRIATTSEPYEFIKELGKSKEFPLTFYGIDAIMTEVENNTGLADQQVDKIVVEIDNLVKHYPQLTSYIPEAIR